MSQPPIPKRLKRIVRHALERGWTLRPSSKNHILLMPPEGTRFPSGETVGPISFASSPSDIRGDRNAISRLRRAGLKDVPRL